MTPRGDLALDERLARIEANQAEEMKLLVQVQIEIAALKVKASFWGAVAGLFVGALTAAAMTKLLGA